MGWMVLYLCKHAGFGDGTTATQSQWLKSLWRHPLFNGFNAHLWLVKSCKKYVQIRCLLKIPIKIDEHFNTTQVFHGENHHGFSHQTQALPSGSITAPSFTVSRGTRPAQVPGLGGPGGAVNLSHRNHQGLLGICFFFVFFKIFGILFGDFSGFLKIFRDY